MKNKSLNKYFCLLFFTIFLLTQISVIGQVVKVPAHLDAKAKKLPPVVAKVEEPRLITVEGCVSGNCIDGFGKMVKERNKEVYEGNWKKGMKEGEGTITDIYSTYVGNWHEDMYEGHGEYKEYLQHDGKLTVSRIYTGNFEKFDHKGQGKCIMYTDWGTKIMFVIEGNFERQQLLGKGSLFIPNEGTYYSDNFTDNFNFTSGRLAKENASEKIEGSLKGGFFTAANVGAVNKNTAIVASSQSNTSSATQSKSMLNYGIFDNNKPTLKLDGKAENYKVYCFVSTCSQGSKKFRVLSKVTANIGKHTFDEIKAEAAHRISNNGWYVQSALEYLGLSTEIKISGMPGKDYALSETDLYDFK